jgi:hypothetical protein
MNAGRDANSFVQGFYALMDKEVFIQAREADVEIVKKAVKQAEAEFEKNAGYTLETEIDTERSLPAER